MKTARDFIAEFHAAYNHEAAEAGELNTENHQLKELILDKFKENYSLITSPDSEILNLWGLFIAMTGNPEIFHYGGQTLSVLDRLVEQLGDIIWSRQEELLQIFDNKRLDEGPDGDDEEEEEEWKRTGED